MERSLLELAGASHREAFAHRQGMAALALAERNASVDARSPFPEVEDYLRDLASRTVCITLLAGSGSRWLKSLHDARSAPPRADDEPWRRRGRDYDSERPRGLFPVRDWLRSPGSKGEALIPVAAYALAAVHGLGRHLIVVRGWQREIDEEILLPLGIGRAERDFFTQETAFGKPLGHGDAVWQCRALWQEADYVLTNFGGDASSRLTARSSLLVLDALNASGAAVDLLIPGAAIQGAAYPIGLDAKGLPRSFGHAKLQGKSAGRQSTADYANVGLRLYRVPALRESVERFRREFWSDSEGYAIPGNDPAGREFALDNVDAELALQGRARLLAFAQPRELSPAKCLEDVPAFEAAVADVVLEDRR